jgi:hypothetical protein
VTAERFAYRVFRHLSGECREGRYRMRESVSLVRSFNGTPMEFESLWTAVEAAKRMNRENRRLGSDYCKGLRFEAGWTGQHP